MDKLLFDGDGCLSLKSANVMPAQPSRASSKEIARPIPEPAPVTRAYPGTPSADLNVEQVEEDIVLRRIEFYTRADVLHINCPESLL